MAGSPPAAWQGLTGRGERVNDAVDGLGQVLQGKVWMKPATPSSGTEVTRSSCLNPEASTTLRSGSRPYIPWKASLADLRGMTMARPSPGPWPVVEKVEKKVSNMHAEVASSMPTPVSLTEGRQ